MTTDQRNRPVINAMPTATSNPARKLRVGYVVFGLLVAVKIIEYLIAKTVIAGNWPYLSTLALVSAWLIVGYYKHITQLWLKEDEDE